MQRKLTPELSRWLHTRCGGFQAYADRDAPTLLAHAATQCVGIVESGGNNRGRFVELFQATVGRVEAEPWCMAFVQSLVAFVEDVCGPSLLPVTEACLAALQGAPSDLVVSDPRQGDIVIWRHGTGWQGHTGIILRVDGEWLQTVEGNTGDGAGIQREGDGVYSRRRPKVPLGTMKIAGFLRPFSYASKPLAP